MTRVIAISDTHSRHNQVKIPDGDILIHAGDITSLGSKDQVSDFLFWFSRQPHKHKIFVAGNHDWWLANHKNIISTIIPSNVTYLNNQEVVIEGIKIYGSPYSSKYSFLCFGLDDMELVHNWNLIPSDTDVLVTHTPSYGVLDTGRTGLSMGSSRLKERLSRLNVKYHICGGVHNAYGVLQQNGIYSINASICTENYDPSNKPIELDVVNALQYQTTT